MSFIAKTDLYTVIHQDELDEITRADDTLVANAISAAEAELKVYLNDSYDITAIFSATGSSRNSMLVQVCADIAVYFLLARDQAGQNNDDRKARFDRGIAWLKAVQKSENYPDLPRRETTAQVHVKYGSNNKRANYY